VETWTDSSGAAHHASQTNASYRPTFKTNILNGLPAIRFVAVEGDYLDYDGSWLANTPFTIFLVDANTTPGSSKYYLAGTGALTNTNLVVGWRTSNTFTLAQYNNDLNVTATNQPGGQVWSIVRSTTGREIWQNGISKGSDTNTTLLTSNPGARIGRFGFNYTNTDIAEILIYTKALTPAERQAVENYLAGKYNISLSSGFVAMAP
jgi:hypothetical protein